MKIFVRAKPKNKKEFVKKADPTHYIVAVKEPPINNKANEEIVKALAKFFDKPSSSIYIVSGNTSKQKVIEVPLKTPYLNLRP